jgi:hypothetical protein
VWRWGASGVKPKYETVVTTDSSGCHSTGIKASKTHPDVHVTWITSTFPEFRKHGNVMVKLARLESPDILNAA